MAVESRDMMAMMKMDQGMGAEAPTLPPSEQGASTPPMASPMSTPEEKKGEQEKARLNIMMALDMLQSAIGAFPPDTEEGKTIEKVVADITRRFGERESDTRQLIPAEILQMIQTLPQAGGATPGQRTAAMAPVEGATAPPLPI
jgi:hypothetical protein